MQKLKCIGCQACVDMCPKKAISYVYDVWGEGHAVIDQDKCINCHLCTAICPNNYSNKNSAPPKCYALISKQNHKIGSSGSFFYEIASEFINNGGIVYGAKFDDNLKLIHTKAVNINQLPPLCKSKYLHSDMQGIYKDIKQTLLENKKVMFVGTPCQVSAVKNLFYKKYQSQLVLVDFLCHGTGTQKIFDYCIKNEENKKKGEITSFTFRSKACKAEHSYTYKIQKNNKIKTKSGYAFEFPYYNAYLTYTIFNDSCYSCQYATKERVSDITLGDFWQIERFSKRFSSYDGTSMIAVNTITGQDLFNKVRDKCVFEQYPLEYSANQNQSYTSSVKYPIIKQEYIKALTNYGADYMIDKYFVRKNIIKSKIYAKTPKQVINIINKLRGRNG